jgi:hypothetical protein
MCPTYYGCFLLITRMFRLLNDGGVMWKHTAVYVNTARTPEKGAHSPSWPNRLITLLLTTYQWWGFVTPLGDLQDGRPRLHVSISHASGRMPTAQVDQTGLLLSLSSYKTGEHRPTVRTWQVENSHICFLKPSSRWVKYLAHSTGYCIMISLVMCIVSSV